MNSWLDDQLFCSNSDGCRCSECREHGHPRVMLGGWHHRFVVREDDTAVLWTSWTHGPMRVLIRLWQRDGAFVVRDRGRRRTAVSEQINGLMQALGVPFATNAQQRGPQPAMSPADVVTEVEARRAEVGTYAKAYEAVAERVGRSASYIKRTHLAHRPKLGHAAAEPTDFDRSLADVRRRADDLLASLRDPGVDLTKPRNAAALAAALELADRVAELEELRARARRK